MLFLNSFSRSANTILIVESGVPSEWAAAAACPPRDTSSCSFAIIASILFNAFSLIFLSAPKDIEKKLKKTSAIINDIGIA